MNRSRFDRLGNRLRAAPPTEDDLRELSEFRETFATAYERVYERVSEVTGIAPTGRPAKSTSAIVAKLRRESIRLSQIQDIAGLRIVVRSIVEQDLAVPGIAEAFDSRSVIDRRDRPSHGSPRGSHCRQLGRPTG